MTFANKFDDRIDEWESAVGPWQPRPLQRLESSMPRRHRAGLLLLIVLGHVLVIWMLDFGSRILPDDDRGAVTTLVFLLPDVPERPAPPEPALPQPTPAPASPRARAEARAQIRTTVPAPKPTAAPAPAPVVPARSPTTDTPLRDGPAPMVAVESPPRPGSPLRLFEADGSLALPEDVVARLEDADGDGRAFDFQRPGLLESGRFMQRQPVLAYEATRFDQYWIPDRNVLTKILEKAVEATTDYIEIPIPGSPGSKLVCGVSILALGGGCGIRNNNDGYVVHLDDPDTLNPEEDAQCRAWWDQIVAAGDQDGWRNTRELYEFSCRKPLAKDTSPPR